MWKACKDHLKYGSFFLSPLVLFLVALSVPITGCSGNPPAVSSAFWRVEVEIPSGREYLRLFLLAEDSDGPSDIEALHLYNDTNELVWIIDGGKLVHQQERGENWYGYSRFELPDGGALPRDLYRAVLIDKAGKRGEYIFRIDRTTGFDPEELEYRLLDQKPERGDGSFPGIEISGSTESFIDVEFRFFAEGMLLLPLDGSAGFTDSGQVRADQRMMAEAAERNALFWSLYLYDRSSSTGIVWGPYPLKHSPSQDDQ
jgi:hypothetical protein